MKPSFEQASKEAIGLLRELIRLDTTNPPGNERIATQFLSKWLGAYGVEPTVLESVPTRASLVARIKSPRGDGGPLMLSAHTDVVPVERESWSQDPFAADIADGCVWGRGTLDMKSKLAMDVSLFAALARSGLHPSRDLIIAAVADEEAGSELGADFLTRRHPDLVRAEYVLNEVGGFTMHFGDRRFYPIQVAEKGFVTLKMKVRGQPGHGSMPRADSVIAKLAQHLTKITSTPMALRISPLMSSVLNILGIQPEFAPPVLRAMLANTVSPTIVRAGYKDNVIPGEAWAILDGRTVPGQDPESFIAELRSIVGTEPEFELVRSEPPCEASPDTPLFDLIRRRTEAADSGARAIPWMIPGATDNKFYSRLGATCYGFSPVKLSPEIPFGSLFHGNNERIPIDGFLWGFRLYAEIILEFLGLEFSAIFA